jgi:hypothetical protein
MALTPARAVAAALIACAGAVVLLLPPQPRRLERSGTYLRTARDQARRELRMAQGAVRIRILRDSARSLAARGAPDHVPSLMVGPWTPAEIDWLEHRVTDILDGHAGAHPVAVVLVRDSLFRFPTLFYALPDTAGAACVALYGEGVLAPGPWLRRPPHRRLAPGLLGPCAYYARFGKPGSAVERWLKDGGAALALTSPSFPPPAWRPPPRHSWLALAIEGGGTWAVDPRLPFPFALEACLGGRIASCEAFLQGRGAANRALRRLGIHEEVAWEFRADEIAFLSDVLVAFGPERFARFWQADGAFPDAFAAAFDVPLGSWTRSWALGRFGPGRQRTRVTAGAVGVSLGVMAGFFALAVLIAGRRRLGA